MLNLLGSEPYSHVGTRFLEPSCGQGAFLTQILERKLKVAGQDPFLCVEALASCYGVELLPDNTQICRDALLDIWVRHLATDAPKLIATAEYIIKRNIICGNFLADLTSGGIPIAFIEYNFFPDGMCVQKQFLLSQMKARPAYYPPLLPLQVYPPMPYDELYKTV